MLTRNLLAGKSRSFEVILLPGQKPNTTNFSLWLFGFDLRAAPDTLFSAILLQTQSKKGFRPEVGGISDKECQVKIGRASCRERV